MAAKVVYVYTKKFEKRCQGKRKAGQKAYSEFINFKDPEVIKRWLTWGYITKRYVKE